MLNVVFVPFSIKCLAGQHPLAVKPEHPADDVVSVLHVKLIPEVTDIFATNTTYKYLH